MTRRFSLGQGFLAVVGEADFRSKTNYLSVLMTLGL
jgi:hypothetical protein